MIHFNNTNVVSLLGLRIYIRRYVLMAFLRRLPLFLFPFQLWYERVHTFFPFMNPMFNTNLLSSSSSNLLKNVSKNCSSLFKWLTLCKRIMQWLHLHFCVCNEPWDSVHSVLFRRRIWNTCTLYYVLPRSLLRQWGWTLSVAWLDISGLTLNSPHTASLKIEFGVKGNILLFCEAKNEKLSEKSVIPCYNYYG